MARPESITWSRDVPVVREPEVLVAGGGPAGWAAALAAARSGARTVLVERWGQLGGMATMGLVMPLSAVRTHHGDRTFPGAGAELIERFRQGYPAQAPAERGEGVYLPADELAHELSAMLREAGVDVWLQTTVLDALTTEGRIATVVVANKSGLLALRPRQVVDATGDGDLAAWAGAPFSQGRPEDGATQPASIMFLLKGVEAARGAPLINTEVRLADLGVTAEQVREVVPPGLPGFDGPPERLPLPQGRVLFFRTAIADEVVVNMTRVVGVDGTCGRDVSRGEEVARRQMIVLVELLRRFVPGFADCRLLKSSAVLGVRQTRSISSPYRLAVTDVLGETRFADAVAFGSYPVDIHNPDGNRTGADWRVPPRAYYEIPYRCLLPQGVGNLLVAGRCLGAEHEAMSSARIMGTCMSTGQAAGVAAALAAASGRAPAEVPAAEVQHGLARAFSFAGWHWSGESR